MTRSIYDPYSPQAQRDGYMPEDAYEIEEAIARSHADPPQGRRVSTQIGNRMTMLASETNARKRIIHVTDPLSGAWVLTITARITSSTSSNINDCLAVLTIGSGAVTQECIVNVSPNVTLQLPSNSLSVDLIWDTLPDDDGAISLVRPDLEITAIVQRGFTNAYAHRVIYMPYGNVLAGAGGSGRIAIPNFAKKWITWSEDTDWWALETQVNFLAGATGLKMFYEGPDLFAAAIQGIPFEVPGGADNFDVTFTGGAQSLDSEATFDFLVQL